MMDIAVDKVVFALVTYYELGIVKLLPMNVHLTLEPSS